MATGFVSAADPSVLDKLTLDVGNVAEHTISVDEIASGTDPGIEYPVKAIVIKPTSGNSHTLYRPNDAGYAVDWDITALVSSSDSSIINTIYFYLSARKRDSDGARYTVDSQHVSRFRMARYGNPTTAHRATLGDITFDVDRGVFQWIRFQVAGTTQRFRRWSPDEAEPSTWDVEAADTFYQTPGVMGFGGFNDINSYRFIWVGWGTDGDLAPTPTGSLDVSAEPFLLRHNPRTDKVIPVLSSPTVTDIGANCVRPRVTKGF